MGLHATKKPEENVIPFLGKHNYISPVDIENLLEDLEDMGYLSDKGIEFRNAFWEMFIKD